MKAQITIDFMIAIGFALVFLIIVLNTINGQEQQRRELMGMMDAKRIIEETASAVDSVYLAGEGSNRTITLPDALQNGGQYTLRIYPKSVLIRYGAGGKMQSTGILPANVDEGGYVELAPGRTMITNSGGKIVFENG